MLDSDSMILSVLSQSSLATAIYGSVDLNIVYANQAMLAMWCADESIIGKTLCSRFPNFQQEGFSSILKNVWKTGITYYGTEVPAHIVNGDQKIKRYFDFEYKALVDENGQCYAILHTASDVTERKLTTSQMERQREELSLSYKLDHLTNTLAHDIKNPLSVLKMGNDFLSRNENLPVQVSRKWYKNFAESIQNMESIIHQTLQLNKVRGIKNSTESIAIDKVIADWIDEVKINFSDKQMQFRLGNLYALHADCASVYQIFTNLIENAVKYAIKTDSAYLYIYSEMTEEGIVYVFEDNGIGIPDDELSRIFDLRKRASNALSINGTGIGLALVKDLMDFLGGTVHLSSQLGEGTVIRLFFPFPYTD